MEKVMPHCLGVSITHRQVSVCQSPMNGSLLSPSPFAQRPMVTITHHAQKLVACPCSRRHCTGTGTGARTSPPLLARFVCRVAAHLTPPSCILCSPVGSSNELPLSCSPGWPAVCLSVVAALPLQVCVPASCSLSSSRGPWLAAACVVIAAACCSPLGWSPSPAWGV